MLEGARSVEPEINDVIAARVRELRGSRRLSLDALAEKAGVSRSMISLIERGKSSPTAVVLDKLAVGLGVGLASLFDRGDLPPDMREPIARRAKQVVWQDPDSGYRRRNVSPAWVPQPARISEVLFPAGARVTFETSAPGVCQQVWMLDGTMAVVQDGTRYRLGRGDCLAMRLDRPATFVNEGAKTARYAVVVTGASESL